MDRCDRCGFVWSALAVEHIAPALRIVGAQFRSRFTGLDPTDPPVEPTTGPWNALDHLAHVQRVLVEARSAIGGTSSGNGALPTGTDPIVAVETAVRDLADRFADLPDPGSPGSHPRADPVTVGRDAVHELAHHLFAISRLVDGATLPASG